MPIDALTLGIGLQGKHDFSLDGLKYQLDTQREEAKAAAEKQKKDYDSWSDPIKQSMAIKPGAVLPAFQREYKNVLGELTTGLMGGKESGRSFGAEDYGKFMDATMRLQEIQNESDHWKNSKNLPIRVQEAINSADGAEWLASKGAGFGVMISKNDRGSVSYAYPQGGMGDFNSVLTDVVKSVPEGELIAPTSNVKTYKQDGKTTTYREKVMDPQRKAAMVDDLYAKTIANPMMLLSFKQQYMGADSDLDIENFDPYGGGVILKPELAAKVRNTISTALDKRVKSVEETSTERSSSGDRSDFEKTMAVSSVSSSPDHLGQKGVSVREVTYVPKKSLPPRSVDVTRETLKVNNDGTGLTSVGMNEVGKPLRDVQKSNMRTAWRGGKGYFVYGSNDNTYYVPLSQKSFTEFVQNTGDSPEGVRENLVKVAAGDDLSIISDYAEFIGKEYNPTVTEKNKKTTPEESDDEADDEDFNEFKRK